MKRSGTTDSNKLPSFNVSSPNEVELVPAKKGTMINGQPKGESENESYYNNHPPLIAWEINMNREGLGI